MPTFGSLFAGIGGIDLGLERAGWEGRWQVEWDDYCQRVLAKHWPDVPRAGDIRDTHAVWDCPLADADGRRDGSEAATMALRGPLAVPDAERRCSGCLEPVDLIAGGFPCQPFSVAGKRLGKADDRWLWPEFARVVGALRPRYVLVENVPGLLAGHGGMGAVLGDLATLGYDAEWDSIPAAAVGAPHLRYRVWIVAHRAELGWPLADADGQGPQGHRSEYGLRGTSQTIEASGSGDVPDPASGRQPGSGQPVDAVHPAPRTFGQAAQPFDGRLADQWSVEPDVGRVAHGVPARVDRLRALGNAVVPQVVEAIGRRILMAASPTATGETTE